MSIKHSRFTPDCATTNRRNWKQETSNLQRSFDDHTFLHQHQGPNQLYASDQSSALSQSNRWRLMLRLEVILRRSVCYRLSTGLFSVFCCCFIATERGRRPPDQLPPKKKPSKSRWPGRGHHCAGHPMQQLLTPSARVLQEDKPNEWKFIWGKGFG